VQTTADPLAVAFRSLQLRLDDEKNKVASCTYFGEEPEASQLPWAPSTETHGRESRAGKSEYSHHIERAKINKWRKLLIWVRHLKSHASETSPLDQWTCIFCLHAQRLQAERTDSKNHAIVKNVWFTTLAVLNVDNCISIGSGLQIFATSTGWWEICKLDAYQKPKCKTLIICVWWHRSRGRRSCWGFPQVSAKCCDYIVIPRHQSKTDVLFFMNGYVRMRFKSLAFVLHKLGGKGAWQDREKCYLVQKHALCKSCLLQKHHNVFDFTEVHHATQSRRSHARKASFLCVCRATRPVFYRQQFRSGIEAVFFREQAQDVNTAC